MKLNRIALVGIAALAALLALAPLAMAQAPQRGGILKFTVPASDPPSFDGHQETTFAVVHAVAPQYSLLVRIDPNDPQAKKYQGDVAESWTASKDGKTYTFKLRKGIKFHDGSPLTSKDVVASFKKIMSPPAPAISPRMGYFTMVDSVTNPDDFTVVFKLKYPTGAFMGVVSMPFNWIYKTENIAKDPNWHKKNVMGSGPFKLKEQRLGEKWVGERYADYHFKGLPYLDGFEAIYTTQENVEIQNLRAGNTMIQFRGFPPAARDDLKKAMGDSLRVQESSWNCGLYTTANPFKKPFNDIRVRQALNLALDRWGGSEYLAKIAIVKTVGGFVFPHHALAMTDDELKNELLGYSPDIAASRAKAKKLLADAGFPNGFKFVLTNRNTPQPYSIVGTWLIDQWRQIGVTVEQKPVPTGTLFAEQRKNPPEFDMIIDFNCQTVVNPNVDVSQFLSDDRTDANSAHYTDRKIDALYDRQLKEPDPVKQKAILKELQIYLANQSYHINTLWWNRIVLSNTKVQGWNISPSHYINNQLDNVWLKQ